MYESFSKDELAQELAEEVGLTKKEALEALDTPGLGTDWAVSLLESRSRHDVRQKRITHHRENIRRAASS
jgi:hypothetical protein